MDLGNPALLISGLFIGVVGAAVFMYGKKQCNLRCLAVGAALCIYPYFVSSLLLLWRIAAGCLGLLALASKTA